MKRFEGMLPAFQMANDENQTEFLNTAPIFYRFNAWFEDVSEMFANIISARHTDDRTEQAEPVQDVIDQTAEPDNDIVATQPGDEHAPPDTAETDPTDGDDHQYEPMPEAPVEFPVFEAEISPLVSPVSNVVEPVEILADADPEPVEPTPETGVETQVTPVVTPVVATPVQQPEITPTTGDEFQGIPIIFVEDLPPADIEDGEDEPAFLDCMF